MTKHSADHATFDLVRVFPVPPSRVFEAWATPELKRAWFACHDDWETVAFELDFRVGGRERNTVEVPGGDPHHFDAIFLDIVPDVRIVYAYEMRLGDRRISVSLATVEFEPSRRGTSMKFTEQAVFLDGYDGGPDRKHGTEEGLARLERMLAGDD